MLNPKKKAKHGLCTNGGNPFAKGSKIARTPPQALHSAPPAIRGLLVSAGCDEETPKRAREASPCNTESGITPKKLKGPPQAPNILMAELGKILDEIIDGSVNKKAPPTRNTTQWMKEAHLKMKSIHLQVMEQMQEYPVSPIQERTPRTRSPAATAVSSGPVVAETTHATNIVGGKWHKVKSKPRPIKKKRPDVIMVKCKDPANYAMVLKSVHTDAGIQQFKENVCAVRRTAAGELLLQLTKPADDATVKLQQAVKQALGDTADVKAISDKAMVEIKDLAEFHTADDLLLAVLELIDEDLPAECHPKMRKAYSGTQTATMMVNPNLANKLLQAGKIRVGMCICRVRLKTEPRRCYKCLDFGHTAARCRSKHDASKLCFNCGSKDHASKQCDQKAACILCTRHKRNNTAHNTLSRACPLSAQDLLKQTVRDLKVDFSILCEPYSHIQDHSWTQNHRYGAAIWSNSRTHLENQHSADGYVRARYNGVYVCSCYIAPSKHIDEFCSILDGLVEDARTHTPTIIAGDFNAWATEWGSQRTTRRGRALLDAFATLNISLLNVGNTHTYNKAGRGSVIDLTFASPCLARSAQWAVSDIYTHSDHFAIVCSIKSCPPAHTPTTFYSRAPSTLSEEALFTMMTQVTRSSSTDADTQANHMSDILRRACDAAMIRKRHGLNKYVGEVVEAGKRINVHKAPGPDGVPALVIKLLVCKHASTFVELFNTCMLQREFPTRWKLQRLVLLPKGDKIDDPSAYRPLCMLDVIGKLFERIICNRLEKELEQRHGLSDWQFGFRRKRSTINAISSVVEIAAKAIEGQRWKGGNKKYCLISTLDVRNAFNSASWDSIIASLERLNISEYIINLICSYFRDRVLLYDTAAGPRKHTITGGVPQGSVIGPTLWNVMYDTVLRLDMPTDTRIVGFVDDIAIVTVAKDIQQAEENTNAAVFRILEWMEANSLSIAAHKTEAVLISSRKKVETARIEVAGCSITSKPAIKYLGVMMDHRLTFKAHLQYTADKAAKATSAITRLMANVGGPKQRSRWLISTVPGLQIVVPNMRAQDHMRV
ncbi:uncharacterized protein [Drosophila tropicalis]|uniref:uncharacterized protein n=1 Tax=Drosophila tropicalis TaxID=46794 RepID=UPI0035ABA529